MARFRAERRRAARWFIFLAAIGGISVFLVASASGTLTGSTFNAGDGNMKVDAGDTHDWQDAATAFGSAYSGRLTDVFSSGTDDAFTSGQKQDTLCPEISGQKSPPKDDFTDAAYATETNPTTGDIYLYGATFRYAGNGNASENIELNQGTNGKCAGGSPLFQRVANDKLIAIDYLSGGTNAEFHVLTWVTGANDTCFVGNHSSPCWGSNVVTLSPAQAEAKENATVILSADNFITSGDVGKFQFAEFGVNLTAALGITGCGKIAGVVIEARASGSSFVSGTKDVVIGNRALAPCPTLTTQATGSTFAVDATTAPISDVATLAGAPANATGNITFKAYGPQTGTPYVCDDSTNLVGTTVVPLSQVNGTVNHAYNSGNINVAAAGDYVFTANLPGTFPASSGCNDDRAHETAHVDKASPALTTNAGSTVILTRNAQGQITGNDLTDSATLSGATLGAVGPIRFKLFSNATCTTQVGSDVTTALSVVGGTKNHGYTSPAVHINAAGTYRWIANLPADNQNNATANGCNEANESITVIDPQIRVVKTPHSQTVPVFGTASWTIQVTNTGDTTLTNVNITDVETPGGPNADCAKTAAELATERSPGGSTFAPGDTYSYTCSRPNVQAAFDNVVVACGTALTADDTCDNSPATLAQRTGHVGVETLTTEQDFLPRDTATLTGLVGTPPGGTLTFSLYNGTCVSGNQLDLNGAPAGKDLTATVTGNNSYTVTSAQLLSEMLGSSNTDGTYNWLVSYGGDAATNNAAITGGCGTENFTVDND